VIIFSWIRYPLLVPVYPAQRNQMCTRLRLWTPAIKRHC
jgi:hypothetical protein